MVRCNFVFFFFFCLINRSSNKVIVCRHLSRGAFECPPAVIRRVRVPLWCMIFFTILIEKKKKKNVYVNTTEKKNNKKTNMYTKDRPRVSNEFFFYSLIYSWLLSLYHMKPINYAVFDRVNFFFNFFLQTVLLPSKHNLRVRYILWIMRVHLNIYLFYNTH